MVRRVGVVGVLLGLAGLLAGCHPPPNPAASSSTSPSPTGPSYTLRSGQATVDGGTRTVLVDAQGFTLYFRSKDSASSVCSASCANTWLPLVQPSGSPNPSPDLTGTLRVSANANGNQLVYNDHPLYRYSGDSAGGQASGEGSGGIWFVAEP
jgi:predicted lipoprotein with Yx(FWY)xxD motif